MNRRLEIKIWFEGDINDKLAHLLMRRAAAFSDDAVEDLSDETMELWCSVSGSFIQEITEHDD